MKIFNCLEGMRQQIRLRSIKFLLLGVLSLWLLAPAVVSAQVVEIPDPNLRAALAEALNKAPGDAITRAEMETLVELRARSREITNLRGIEFAINLDWLDLWHNTISDISPLASLTNLHWLNLWSSNISDISPLASLTNLESLHLGGNNISDISPVARLTNLESLHLWENTISDISAVASLTNLHRLALWGNTISDISAVASLTNLTTLDLSGNTISDISAVASLTNLTVLYLGGNSISDISPVASLTNLTTLGLSVNTISDISAVASLTNLDWLDLVGNTISDISAVASLTNLELLALFSNNISDISPVASLTNLTVLYLQNNNISDIFPLITLTNLTRLYLQNNNISDISPLEWLMARGTVVYFRGNPAFETPGPKIEEGWVWLMVPTTDVFNGSDAAASGRDFLSEASDGAVTEADVALNGARAGSRVGNSVWTSATLNAADPNNLGAIVRDTDIDYPVAYGVVSIQSETLQETRVYIGGGPVKVWFNGTLVYKDTDPWSGDNYETAVPVQLVPGENVLLIAAYRPYPWSSRWGAFFGFQDGTGYTIGSPSPEKITGPWLWMIAPTEPGLGGADSTDVDSLAMASGGTVTEADIATNGANVGDEVGNLKWTPGEISPTGGDNINDTVTRIGLDEGDIDHHSSYALITLESASAQFGVTMRVGSDDSIKVWLNGEVVHKNAINRSAADFQDTFTVNLLQGDNLLLVKVSERREAWSMFVGIDAEVNVLPPPDPLPGPGPNPGSVDVNGDGRVDVLDLAIVALFYGTQVPVGISFPADVNADGIVNILDLTAVAQGIDAASNAGTLAADDVGVVLEAVAEQANAIDGVAEAPAHFSTSQQTRFSGIAYRNVAAAFSDVKHLATDDARLGKWMPLLQELLHRLTEMQEIPDTTALLPNYPNPFNPETWIPYQLAAAAEVAVTIYDVRGGMVRALTFGHQPAGVYESRGRAAYWDGKNQTGEPVASGVYFYTLSAGDFTATRKLLIRK